MTRLPLKPIYMAFLVVLVYFLILTNSILALFLLIWAMICLYRHYDRKVFRKISLLLLIVAGWLYAYEQHQEVSYQNTPTQVNQLKVIPDTLEINGDQLSFRARDQGYTYQVFYQVVSEQEKRYFQELDQAVKLSVTADVLEAEEQRHFKGFDYRAYLKTQGIYRIVKIKTIHQVTAVNNSSLLDYLHYWRRKAIVHIQRVFPSPIEHYLTGLLFGYLGKEFDEMRDIYSSLGIIHLFALSGMHVGFFMGVFQYGLLRMSCRKDIVAILSLPISFLYAGLTGFSISVMRSLIQVNLSNMGVKKLNNFSSTLFLMMLIRPSFLLTTGGVLSFSFAFILAMVDTSKMTYPKMGEIIVLNLGMLPILCWYFGVFNPMAMLLTALLSTLFRILLLPVLTVIFLSSFWVPLTIFNPIFQLLEGLLLRAYDLFSKPLVFGSPSTICLIFLIITLGVLFDYYRHKKVMISLMMLLSLLFFVTKYPLKNEVTVLDVGQGDSILIRDSWGKTILIDVGGKVDFAKPQEWQIRKSVANAERTLIPYLRGRGIGKIDQLVLTHTDTDHMGDMEVVAKSFSVGEILVSEGSLTNQEFVKRLKALTVSIRSVTAGDRLPVMGTYLQVLYPYKVGDGGNNDSIVLYGHLLNQRFLFTGDLEDGEYDLIEKYPNLKVDILKAGHHGSKGSSFPEFLDRIDAKIALISAGKNNRYQHPHPETLERFKERGMIVYRTDKQGAIRFTGWWNWKMETVR